MEFINKIKDFLKKTSHSQKVCTKVDLEKLLVIQGQALSRLNPRKLQRLSDAEFKVFSQWGEDGILDWLINALPDIPSKFVEFGTSDYQESNTRYILLGRNWSGLVLDSDTENIKAIKSNPDFWKYDLTAERSFVTSENINRIISKSGIGNVGILSIDIDGNDLWVWDSIEVIKPIIVVSEYNAVFGDQHPISIPYIEEFFRTSHHFSNLYFGASISALMMVGKKKGYTLVGTNSSGCNAFFIRDDFASFVLDSLDEVVIYPSGFREGRDRYGNLNFIRGLDRIKALYDCEIYDLYAHESKLISDLDNIYSLEWSEGEPRILKST